MKIIFLIMVLFSLPALASGSFHLFKRGIVRSSSSHPRDIYVYLPPGYDKSHQNYPVLYMHDGQNLFDPSRGYLGQTWRAHTTLNHLIEKNIIAPVIVVAIDNTPERMEEYIPEKKADDYLNFLVDVVKPQVDQAFRTIRSAESTGIMGSSLGGLVSLYAGMRNPDVFGMVGALSPSIWWNERSLLVAFENAPRLPLKIYLDSGTSGGEKPQDVIDLTHLLLNRNYRHYENILTYIQDGADHQERYWASRFPIALKFLFPIK